MLYLDKEARNYAYMRWDDIMRGVYRGFPEGDDFHNLMKISFEDGYGYEHSTFDSGSAILPVDAAYRYAKTVPDYASTREKNFTVDFAHWQTYIITCLEVAFIKGGMFRRKNRSEAV